MKQPDEFGRFVAILTQHAPKDLSAYTIAQTAEALRSIARRMDKINERQCNGYSTWDGKWDEKAEARDDKRWERLEARALSLAAPLGFSIETQGDPRGWPLKLLRGGEPPNTGSAGIGVPL